jgi:hypothetical protein
MKVTVSELRILFEKLMNKMEENGILSLDINDIDYYWIVSSDEWTNFETDVSLDVGSLIDDWKSLQKVISEEHIPTYVDFDRLASILRAVSETIIPLKDG